MADEPTEQPSQPRAQPPADEAKEGVDKRGIITIVVIFGGLFLMLLIFSVLMITAFGDGEGWGAAGGEKVGVIEVTGPIMASKKTVEDIRRFERDESIKGILVRIDSPGGAVAPSQEIYEAVKRAKAEKPVVCSMGSTAASGGYYIAIGCQRIFANSGSITGSIGVISQMFNVQGLLDKADVSVEVVKTGRFKDSGSPFREMDPQERAYFKSLMMDIYDQFVDDVAEQRKLERAEVLELADGRVYTGRQALDYKLIDELGTMHDAVEYIKSEAGIEAEARLVYPPKEDLGFLTGLVEGMTDAAVDGVRNATTNAYTPAFEYRMVVP